MKHPFTLNFISQLKYNNKSIKPNVHIGHISCSHLFGQPLEVLPRLPDVAAVGQPAVEGPAWEKKENSFFTVSKWRGAKRFFDTFFKNLFSDFSPPGNDLSPHGVAEGGDGLLLLGRGGGELEYIERIFKEN